MSRKFRLAYLVSHPIQYQAPLLARISREPEIDLTVLFCSDLSVREYEDREFKASFKWDVPLLCGYRHEFLPALGATDRLSYWRPMTMGLHHWIDRSRFDALWVHGWGYFSHLRAILLAKARGMPVMLRGESILQIRPRAWWKQAAREMLIRRVVRAADAHLAIGSWNRDFYLHYGADPARLFSMPYAVDNDFFRARCEAAARDRDALRQSLGLEPGRPVILYASKMTSRKRSLDLLDAYIKLAPNRHEPHPYLLFVGDGELRPLLEQRARETGWDSLRFLGFKNQTELPAFFDLCDVFVLPSFDEPWGLVVNEVMNAGRAVIVSDQVGCGPDLVRHGENGWVFRAGDVEGLNAGLRFVLENPEHTRALGERSREIIANWGFEQDVQGLKQALNAIMQGAA